MKKYKSKPQIEIMQVDALTDMLYGALKKIYQLSPRKLNNIIDDQRRSKS